VPNAPAQCRHNNEKELISSPEFSIDNRVPNVSPTKSTPLASGGA